MAKRKAPSFPPADWQADNVTHLRRIWHDLQPESKEGNAERRFAGQLLTAEQAGDVFERWVLEAFRLSGHQGHYPFRVSLRTSGNTREQIDGMVVDGWQASLIESKFWTDKVDFGPIALFHTLLESRPAGTLGLFFSAFGYTVPALESAEMLRPVRVLLFDDRDLEWAMSKGTFKGRMRELVRRKWLAAVMYGPSFMPAPDDIDLFN